MIRKSAFTGWSALKDSYHLQQARENFSEPDYLNALAQAIQEVIRRLLKVHAAKASAEGAALAPLQVAPIPNAYPLHQCLVDVFILGKQLVRDVEQYQNFWLDEKLYG